MFFLLLASLISDPPFMIWNAVPEGGVAAIENAGDIDLDGTDDVFVGWAEATGGGTALLSGFTGDTIWTECALPGVACTEALHAIPDVNGDGHADFAAALSNPSLLSARSGADGEYLWLSSQDSPVLFLEHAACSATGEVLIIGNRIAGVEVNNTFFAVDPVTATETWSHFMGSSDDFRIRTTSGDVSGNGWSELGFAGDRGTAGSGDVWVLDGLTGDLIQETEVVYFPRMDICDSPPIMTVSHFGYEPALWLENIQTGSQIWGEPDFQYIGDVFFTGNADGPSAPWPDILCINVGMTLFCSDDGSHGNMYVFQTGIVKVEHYLLDGNLMFAVLTDASLITAEASYDPGTYPEFLVPGSGHQDLCLLNSSSYPSPIAVVASSEAGPGVCAIATSWPVSTEDASRPMTPAASFSLEANPSAGGLLLRGHHTARVSIMDIAGRTVGSVRIESGGTDFIPLSPGIYLLKEESAPGPTTMAVVL